MNSTLIPPYGYLTINGYYGLTREGKMQLFVSEDEYLESLEEKEDET